MKWTNTFLLILAAGAVFAFIYFYERKIPARPPAHVPTKLLPKFKAKETSAIQLRRGSSFSIRVERTNEQWRLSAPFAYPAASIAVDRFLNALEQAVIATHISAQELNARKQSSADFGFDNPQGVVSLHQEGQREEIQFGALTAAGDQVYAQIIGQPGVFVIDAALLKYLPGTISDWRNTSLFNTEGLAFDRIELLRIGSGFALQRDATNKLWRLVRPTHRADQFKVEQLVAKMSSAQVAEFVSDNPNADLDRFGLHQPSLDITLLQGSNRLQRVQFGISPTNDTTRVYARRFVDRNIVLVPKSVVEDLRTSSTELRDRRLISFDPNTIEMIDVLSPEPFNVRKQTNGAWVVNQSLAADQIFVEEWLTHLSQIQVSEFVKDVEIDFSAYGLGAALRRYTLRSSRPNAPGVSDAVVAQLEFGTNNSGNIFARRSDEDSVYGIRLLDFHAMPWAAWQLRDHRVWNFATNEVVRIIIKQQGQTRELVRQPNGAWTFAEGFQGVINPWSVEETMFRLGQLDAVTWVARGEEARALYGFNERNYAISIELKSGEKSQTFTIEFGGNSPVRLPYASTVLDGQRWIFEFPWPLYLNVQRDLGIPPKGSDSGGPAVGGVSEELRKNAILSLLGTQFQFLLNPNPALLIHGKGGGL